MNKSCSIVILLILTCFCAKAQESLSLNDAIGIALKNNYDIIIAKNDSAIASLNYTAGNSGMLPKIGIQASNNYSLSNVEQKLNSGSEINKNGAGSNSFNAALALNWTIFDGMKMFASRQKFALLKEQGQLALKNKIQNLIAQVYKAYYDVTYQMQQIKVQQEILKVSEERFKIGKLRFENGSASKSEMLQAQVDLNAGKAQILQLKNNLLQKKIALNELLSRAPDIDFSADENIDINKNISYADFSNSVNNISILQSEKNVQLSKLYKKEIQSQQMPSLSLSAAYSFVNTNNDASVILQSKTLGPSVGVSLYIPLFNGLNVNRQIKTTSLDIISKENELEKIKLQVNNSLLKAYKTYALYIDALKLEEENIVAAKENLDISVTRLKLSQTTAMEVIVAQNSLTAAYTRLLQAQINAKFAEIDLLLLSGKLVK